MAKARESTLARLEIAQANEELVIAENALLTERTVGAVRIAAVLFQIVAGNIAVKVAAVRPETHVIRLWVIGAYLIFTVTTFWILRWVKPSVAAARRGALVFVCFDYGFLISMSLFDWQFGQQLHPERLAIMMVVAQCFSIGRASASNVIVSTVFSGVGYLAVSAFNGSLLQPTYATAACFVIGGYCVLGLLLYRANQRVRHMFVEIRRRDNLTRFLAPQVVNRVMRLGDTSLAPVQREVTVLFCDIRGFTAFSELLPPGVVLSFLDEYLGHMSSLVKAHDGIVNKFLGDGLLAFWGVPERNADHAVLAVKAALDMRKVVAELNDVRRVTHAEPIRIGIGVHTGTVAAGMLGGADQHEYTVIGDAVNLASRIEGLTKRLGVDLLVSETTWHAVQDRFEGSRASVEPVKGRDGLVAVYSVTSARSRRQAG